MSLNNLSATNISGALIDAGDFVINKRLVSNNQILYYTDPVTSIKTGYVWKGTLPHITSTNNPNTDGGISDTAWVPVIYSKLKEKMETEGLTLDWNAHLPTVEVAYGLTKNSLKMWKSGTTATSDDYWLYTDGTVWNGVGVLGSTPETSTGFEKITPNFNASIKTYSASATDGQTVFNIPFTFSTITVFVNGSIKLPGLNYTVSGNTVTFTTELEAGDLLYVFIGNPNISTNDKLNRIYTANAMQGQTTIQVPYDFSTAIVYINGVLQNPSTAYSIGADRIITFSEELYQDDEIIVMLGDIIIQSDEYILKTEIENSDGFSYIGQAESINELISIKSDDGNRVLVKSYHTGTNYGGGEFYYDSSKNNINNGVTIFNGWVRILKRNILTDLDAGCIIGSTEDVSSNIKNLFSVINDGMIIELHCLNYVSSNFIIKNTNNFIIKGVNGNCGFYCWDFRDNFTFNFDTDFELGNSGLTGSIGILSFYNCSYGTVTNIKITGIQKVIPQSREWGDCAIRYEKCQYFKIHKNTFKHFGGWGIFGAFGSNNCECSYNFIQHVHRQSGINIFANSNNNIAHHNIISDIGLYGGEFETFPAKENPNVYGNKFIDNIIDTAKIGICSVGPMIDGYISRNEISNCVGGLASIGVNYNNSTSVEYIDNTVKTSWYGISVNNSYNISFYKNIIDYTTPTYLITDQYQAPVKLVDGDNYSFYCTLPIAANKIIKIADTVYTVSSYSSISSLDLFGSSTYYGVSTFYKITLTTEINDDFYTFANILFSWSTLNTTNGSFGIITNNTAFSQANVIDGAKNLKFINNIINGVKYGINPNNTYNTLTTIQETYSGNSFNCESWIRTGIILGDQISLNNNEPSISTSMTSIVTGSSTTNWIPSRIEKFVGNNGITSGTAFPINYISVDKTSFIIGYKVTLKSWSTTSNIKLIIANTNENQIITTSTSGSLNLFTSKKHLYAISPGTLYPVYLSTDGNVMSASWYSIEIMIL